MTENQVETLLDKPNPDQNRQEFLDALTEQTKTHGIGLVWMIQGVMGWPVELWVLDTYQAVPQPAVVPDYPEGYYRIVPTDTKIPAKNVLRVRSNHDTLTRVREILRAQ